MAINNSTEDHLYEAPAGWHKLLRELLDVLHDVPGWDNGYIAQIKEKFGGLRFYYDYPAPDEEQFDIAKVDALIKLAEARAWKTCQQCGVTGAEPKGNPRGWIFTMCESCRQEHERLRSTPTDSSS